MILTERLCSLYVSSPGLKVAGLMPKIHYLEAVARKFPLLACSAAVQRLYGDGGSFPSSSFLKVRCLIWPQSDGGPSGPGRIKLPGLGTLRSLAQVLFTGKWAIGPPHTLYPPPIFFSTLSRFILQ